MTLLAAGAAAAAALRFRVEFIAGSAVLVAEPLTVAPGVELRNLELALPPLLGPVEFSPRSTKMLSAQTSIAELDIEVESGRVLAVLGETLPEGGAELHHGMLRTWSWVGRAHRAEGGVEAVWQVVAAPLAPDGWIGLLPVSVVGAGAVHEPAWGIALASLERLLERLSRALGTPALRPRHEGGVYLLPIVQWLPGVLMLAAGRRMPRVVPGSSIGLEFDGSAIRLQLRAPRRGATMAETPALTSRAQTLRALADVDDALARGAPEEALSRLEQQCARPDSDPVAFERLVDLLLTSGSTPNRARAVEVLRALPQAALGAWADGALTRAGVPVEGSESPPVLAALAAALPGLERAERLGFARAALARRPGDPALQQLCVALASSVEPDLPHEPTTGESDAQGLGRRRRDLERAVATAHGAPARAAALGELGVFLYQDFGDDQASLAALREAFELAPEQADARALSAAEAAAREVGDTAMLLMVYDLRCRVEPEMASTWRLLQADAHAAGGHIGDAVRIVTGLLPDAEDPEPLLARRARWYRQLGHAVEAAADLRTLIARAGTDSFERIEHLRTLAALTGLDVAERTDALREIVAAVPGDSAAMLELVRALRDGGDPSGALVYLGRRIRQLTGRSELAVPEVWSAIELEALDLESAEAIAQLLGEALPVLEDAGADGIAEAVGERLIRSAEHAPAAAELAVEWARASARFALAARGASRLAELVFDETEQSEWRQKAERWGKRDGGPKRAATASVEPAAVTSAIRSIDVALLDSAWDAALELVANWLPRVTQPAPRKQLLLRRARALLGAERYDEAVMPLRGATILGPDDADVLVEQALLAHALGDGARLAELVARLNNALRELPAVDGATAARLELLRARVPQAADQNGTESS